MLAKEIMHTLSHQIAIVYIIKTLERLLELPQISSGHVLGVSPHQGPF